MRVSGVLAAFVMAVTIGLSVSHKEWPAMAFCAATLLFVLTDEVCHSLKGTRK